MQTKPRITAETLDRVNDAIDRLIAVADFARHDAITEQRAATAGFYADEALGSPETLLYGPDGAFEYGCDVHGAWLAHTELTSGEADYHVTAGDTGAMTMTMHVAADDPGDSPVELTLGMNDRLGLHADPVTIQALGGTPSHPLTGVAEARFDRDTGMPVDLENLAAANVPADERQRLWTALNEASHTHPSARLARHYSHNGDERDLPHHEMADRALLGIEELTPPAGAVSPARAGRLAPIDRDLVEHELEAERDDAEWFPGRF